jgi:hypothetical protein
MVNTTIIAAKLVRVPGSQMISPPYVIVQRRHVSTRPQIV